MQVCLFCGGDANERGHAVRCDGRQGRVEDALPFTEPAEAPDFDGDTYERPFDHERLGAQALRVWTVVSDGQWRTLGEIEAICGDPQASISARLRDFRKDAFGGHAVERRRRGEAEHGWFEYRVLVSRAQPVTR
jgi:hypothetical protein